MFSYTTARGVRRRAPAAARLGEGVARQARAGLPRHRHGRRRPRPVRAAQVRLRGVDPDAGPLPRADLDLELHRLPGPPPRHPRPLPGRAGRHPAARHAQRHAGRDPAHDRRDPRDPPAGRTARCGCPKALQPYLQGREVLEPVGCPAVDASAWQPEAGRPRHRRHPVRQLARAGRTVSRSGSAPAVVAAVNRAYDAGAHVVLATGRSTFGITDVWDLLGPAAATARDRCSRWPATAR